LGMVSKTDLLAHEADQVDSDALAREFPPVGELLRTVAVQERLDCTAGDLMSTPLLCVPDTETVAGAARSMSTHCVHRLGVTDARGRLVGMVSTLDVVRWLARHGAER
jgi:CBS domain-containing protein